MIIFENGTQLENYGSIIGATRGMRGKQRESLEIMIRDADYETLAELFVDGARFSVQTPDEKVYDKHEYNIAGDIADKRDGTFVVYMGVRTETEELEESLAGLLLRVAGGIEVREHISVSRVFESVKRFYIEGYGIPIKHYNEADLSHLVSAGMITKNDMDAIIKEKPVRDKPANNQDEQPEDEQNDATPAQNEQPKQPGQDVIVNAGV